MIVLFSIAADLTVFTIHASEPIELNGQCPPYFRLDQERFCQLNSLYDLYPSVNPLWGGYRVALPERRDGFSPEQIDLGRYLFFDSILSDDEDLSCAHCHHPQHGLTDGRPRSMGRHGKGVGPTRTEGIELTRSAPPLWNLAFQQTFFWDNRVTSLEDQILMVFSTTEEMATNPQELVGKLNAIPAYQKLFQQVFGTTPIEFDQVLSAIVAFETTLISLNSRYDQYIHGDQDILNNQELNGLHVFRSFATRCSQCHTPPLFTSGQIAGTGVPPTHGQPFDEGAGAISNEPSLVGAFKVPTLRNIALTAPYMHAGQFSTLTGAVSFYNHEPGHALPDRDDLTFHWHVNNPHLSTDEITDLVAFLHTLNDETAMPKIPARVPSGLAVP